MTINDILNTPEYAKDFPFIVAREYENELWFWGAFDTRNEANRVARKIGGVLVEND